MAHAQLQNSPLSSSGSLYRRWRVFNSLLERAALERSGRPSGARCGLRLGTSLTLTSVLDRILAPKNY